MNKLNLNKLIANDIINYGIEATTGRDYAVSLELYLEEYDEETRKYISNNLDEIVNEISNNENIFFVQKLVDKNEIDMIFHFESVLNQVEKIVLKNAELFNIDLELDDIREVASVLLEDDSFNDDLICKIKNIKNGIDI
ncbi:MAG: hypothetical protein RR404_04415 [Bacilli bacterium]